jgi:hypothetical protein
MVRVSAFVFRRTPKGMKAGRVQENLLPHLYTILELRKKFKMAHFFSFPKRVSVFLF